MSGIPCRFKDGTPVSEEVANMITHALLGMSAPATERLIAEGERKRKRRQVDEQSRADVARRQNLVSAA
ncbi:hypothetical protein ACFXHA_45065 [Nocardia sp. NPDC059240]|uniref:hypothetical protein n=1 Tax=Nocardia sp. NPDC059240 TaxID=3346786 RepID=UPI0036B3E3A4